MACFEVTYYVRDVFRNWCKLVRGFCNKLWAIKTVHITSRLFSFFRLVADEMFIPVSTEESQWGSWHQCYLCTTWHWVLTGWTGISIYQKTFGETVISLVTCVRSTLLYNSEDIWIIMSLRALLYSKSIAKRVTVEWSGPISVQGWIIVSIM